MSKFSQFANSSKHQFAIDHYDEVAYQLWLEKTSYKYLESGQSDIFDFLESYDSNFTGIMLTKHGFGKVISELEQKIEFIR
jgi:hypothetical protein